MKNIVVIVGSPRKGNNYKILNILETEMNNFDEITFDYVFLKKINLEFCRGCLACMKKGEEKCPVKDDAIMLRDKLLSADGIIFSSPVYVHTVSALMKNFIDRFAYFCHRPAFFDKPVLLECTTELSGIDETLEYMDFPANMWGFHTIHKFGIIFPSFNQEGPYRDKMLSRIKIIAQDFYKSLSKGRKKSPSSMDMTRFNMLKTKVTLHKDKLKYDYDYWQDKGWIDSHYYYEAKINPVNKAIGLLKVSLIKKVIRKKVADRF